MSAKAGGICVSEYRFTHVRRALQIGRERAKMQLRYIASAACSVAMHRRIIAAQYSIEGMRSIIRERLPCRVYRQVWQNVDISLARGAPRSLASIAIRHSRALKRMRIIRYTA